METAVIRTTLNGTSNAILNTTFTSCQPAQDSTFTRANVFGMFLTLQFVQLTQPYGSLLFQGTSGFWWRVNPIASLAEGVLIFWQLWTSRSRTRAKKHKWQIIAASLLLLRGVVMDEECTELMRELLRGTFLDRDRGEQLPAGTVDSGAAEGQVLDNSHSTPKPIVRRRTSQLEANAPSIESDTSQSRESRLLSAAFGGNALAHYEWRIDLVTWLSVAAIVLKLLAISGAEWYRVACSLLLVGWAAVQILISLFHVREMDLEGKRAAIRLSQVLDKELDKMVGVFVYSLLHAPVFGYVSYRLAFEPFFPAGTFGRLGKILSFIPVTILSCLCFILVAYAIQMIFKCLASLFSGKLKDSAKYFLICIGSLCLGAVSLLLSWSAFMSSPDLMLSDDEKTPTTNISPKYMINDYYNSTDALGIRILEGATVSAYFVYNGAWFLLYLAVFAVLFVLIFLPFSDKDRSQGTVGDNMKVSTANFCFTVTVFALFLVHYDDRDTNKPAWSEFLG